MFLHGFFKYFDYGYDANDLYMLDVNDFDAGFLVLKLLFFGNFFFLFFIDIFDFPFPSFDLSFFHFNLNKELDDSLYNIMHDKYQEANIAYDHEMLRDLFYAIGKNKKRLKFMHHPYNWDLCSYFILEEVSHFSKNNEIAELIYDLIKSKDYSPSFFHFIENSAQYIEDSTLSSLLFEGLCADFEHIDFLIDVYIPSYEYCINQDNSIDRTSCLNSFLNILNLNKKQQETF